MANAGLLLRVTLTHHLGPGELVDRHVDLGDAPGRAKAGDNLLTLVASALAGGDCIDDADVLRTGGTAQQPSDLGNGQRNQIIRRCRPPVAASPVAGNGQHRKEAVSQQGRCDVAVSSGPAPCFVFVRPASNRCGATLCCPLPRSGVATGHRVSPERRSEIEIS